MQEEDQANSQHRIDNHLSHQRDCHGKNGHLMEVVVEHIPIYRWLFSLKERQVLLKFDDLLLLKLQGHREIEELDLTQ